MLTNSNLYVLMLNIMLNMLKHNLYSDFFCIFAYENKQVSLPVIQQKFNPLIVFKMNIRVIVFDSADSFKSGHQCFSRAFSYSAEYSPGVPSLELIVNSLRVVFGAGCIVELLIQD